MKSFETEPLSIFLQSSRLPGSGVCFLNEGTSHLHEPQLGAR